MTTTKTKLLADGRKVFTVYGEDNRKNTAPLEVVVDKTGTKALVYSAVMLEGQKLHNISKRTNEPRPYQYHINVSELPDIVVG